MTTDQQFNCDYMIVGQGIAGSMLAHFLLQQNKRIVVIDKSYPNSASNVAAGIANPITGRKMVKSWLVDQVLPFAKSTYKILEQQLQTKFFYENEIYRLFTSNEDIEVWNQKRNNDEYKNYLGNIIDTLRENITAPFGAGIIKQCFWIDVPVFIKAYRNFLKTNDYLLEETFNMDELVVSKTIQYKNIVADKLIFCEGYHAHQNPFFNFIPFSLAKGEQLTIYAPDLQNGKVLSKGIFILPKKNDIYNVGSTFIWNDLEERVTENGRKEIKNKLYKIVRCKYTIVEEKAAIRPTIKDRRPVIGVHPSYSNLYILNGLGTKGVSLAPYFAHHLTSHLILHNEIMNEVAVSRSFNHS